MKNVIDQVLKKMLLKNDLINKDVKEMLEEAYEIGKDPEKMIEEKSIAFINQTPIGKKIAAAGFDIRIIIRMAKGETDAIVEFAIKRGIPKPIAEALIALLL